MNDLSSRHDALLYLFACSQLVHVEEEVVGRAGRDVAVSASASRITSRGGKER